MSAGVQGPACYRFALQGRIHSTAVVDHAATAE